MAFDRSSIKWASLYVMQNGRPVDVPLARLSDAQIKSALGMQANKSALAGGWQRLSNGQIMKQPMGVRNDKGRLDRGTAKNKPANGSTPTSTETVTPKPLGPIDPRDGAYQSELAQSAFDRDNSIASQEARRKTLPSLYNRGMEDTRVAYNRDRYGSNAELASRGIIRSGEYQHRGADRLMQDVRTRAGIEQQYGLGAQSEIASSLAQINQKYALSQAAALQAAKDRYAQQYPASNYVWASTQ